jgi:hypothetical protein
LTKKVKKKNFPSRQNPANFTRTKVYTMRQRATAAALIFQSISSFAGRGPTAPDLRPPVRASENDTILYMEEQLMMDYQKEYASLVGQIDRAISILENYAPGDPIVRKAGDLLLSALQEAEEHYLGEG